MDAQIDHTTGLMMLREGRPLEIYCTDMAREDLSTGNPLFKILGHYCGVNWHKVPTTPGNSFPVIGAEELIFTAVPLKSNAPPYSPHRDHPLEGDNIGRSEEHTSELQSPDHLVCRLLLEKKKYAVRHSLPT